MADEQSYAKQRTSRAKKNIVVSLLFQAVTFICGMIIPRMMIDAFGSEGYGATGSITQFLAYVTLLEGGIGGVARAALYKPLANKNWDEVSSIVYEVKRFFRIIGWIFAIYVLILACSFHWLAHIEVMSWLSTFLLVLAISISNFAQYFIGLPYIILVQAAQKTYVTYSISIVTTIANAVLTVVLILMGCNLVIVKLVSSLVFIARPIYVWWYVRKHYPLNDHIDTSVDYLPQRWSGLSQHIAFFLHSNTDIAVLTIFANLSLVAVYSVYSMIITHVQAFCSSMATGMEALFGDMIARKDKDGLYGIFGHYETLISVITMILMSTTAALIVPFIRVYTAGIEDANYIRPVFAFILILVSIFYCLRMPYHSVVIAAGHFKQTRMASYGEAILNIALSLLLVMPLGITGVALATLIATSFRFIWYVIYLHSHILDWPYRRFLRRLAVNMACLVLILLASELFLQFFTIDGYLTWAIAGVVVAGMAGVIVLLMNFLFYKSSLMKIIAKGLNKA